MAESSRRKGKEPMEEIPYVSMIEEEEDDDDDDEELNVASCSIHPIPGEVRVGQREEENSFQVLPKRKRREEPLKAPPGFHFRPSDEELAFKYLLRKKLYNIVPYDIAKEVDAYSKHPTKLIDEYNKWGEEGKWYFFTSRYRKYPKGGRPARHTRDGTGYWKATGSDKKMDSHPDHNALKKTLVFHEGKAPNGIRTDWIMHEFVIIDKDAQKEPLDKKVKPTEIEKKWDGLVLCDIQRKRGAERRGKKNDVDATEIDVNPNNQEIISQEYPVPNEIMRFQPEDKLVSYLTDSSEHPDTMEMDTNAHNHVQANQHSVSKGYPDDQLGRYLINFSEPDQYDFANQPYMASTSGEQFLPDTWDPLDSLSFRSTADDVENDLYTVCEAALSVSPPKGNVQDNPEPPPKGNVQAILQTFIEKMHIQ